MAGLGLLLSSAPRQSLMGPGLAAFPSPPRRWRVPARWELTGSESAQPSDPPPHCPPAIDRFLCLQGHLRHCFRGFSAGFRGQVATLAPVWGRPCATSPTPSRCHGPCSKRWRQAVSWDIECGAGARGDQRWGKCTPRAVPWSRVRFRSDPVQSRTAAQGVRSHSGSSVRSGATEVFEATRQ